MGALTPTIVKATELGGDYKILDITATLESASDDIVLTAATHGISEIVGVVAIMTAGMDAACTAIAATYSGLTITVTSVEADGTASTAWTDTTIELFVIGK